MIIPLCIPRPVSLQGWRKYSLGVVASIRKQTTPVNFIDGFAPGAWNSLRIYTEERCIGEAASRNECLRKLRETGSEFYLMQDPDIVQNYPDNFERMIDILKNDPTLGLLSIKNGPHDPATGVVDIGCIAGRTAALPETFTAATDTCMCAQVCAAVWQKGFKVGFLTNTNLITEV